MKYIFYKKKTTVTGITWLLFILAVSHFSCNKKLMSWQSYVPESNKEDFIVADTTKQILVWRTPGSDTKHLNDWLDSIKRNCGDFQIPFVCQDCDNSLMLLTGAGIQTFIQGSGTTKGGGAPCVKDCPPAGGGDTIYWCVNFPVDINDSSSYNQNMEFLPAVNPMSYHDPAVKVAVFDTGVDPTDIQNYLYSGSTPCCLGSAAKDGWNFSANNAAVADDYNLPVRHGATVARMIVDQADFYKKNRVSILPVKIHNSRGQSSLYNVLCGFAYAKERGAQIINASFGYYALKPAAGNENSIDPGALLLKKYIKYYLTDNHILLIAAAGNKNVKDNDASEIALFTNAGLTPPANLHNLDNVNFYPASLSADPEMTNVIAVTTVHNGTITPFQNYSNTVVDIGVNADVASLSNQFFFKNPMLKNGFVEGSSFATPVLTGIICAHYTEITNQFPVTVQSFNKDNILNFLMQMSIGQHVPSLDPFIRKGVMFTNAHAW